MADEVVGDVRIDVHGNTTPLKNDVRLAAHDISKTIDAEVSSSSSTAITDHIVEQVGDAEQPSGREARKVGRAIAKGVDVGTQDVDTKSRIAADLRRAEAPLRSTAARLGRALGLTTGESMSEARQEALSKAASEDVKVKIDIDRDQFQSDLTATSRDWNQFGDSMNRALEQAFTPWWRARSALREDVKVTVTTDREQFQTDLAGIQDDLIDTQQALSDDVTNIKVGIDRKQFQTDLTTIKTDLTDTQEVKVRVTVDQIQFQTELASIRADLVALSDDVKIKVGIDRDEFQTDLIGIQDDLSETRAALSDDVTIKVNIDRDQFQTDLIDIQADTQAALSEDVNLTVNLDREQFQADLATTQAELKALRRAVKVKVGIDREAFQTDVAATQTDLLDIQTDLQAFDQDVEIKVGIDEEQLEFDLIGLQADLEALTDVSIGIDRDELQRDLLAVKTDLATLRDEDVEVEIRVDRDQFRTDLMATENDWDAFGTSMNRALERAFLPWHKTRAALREDVKVQVRVDREKFAADLTGAERDWFDFGDAMGKSLDAAMAPWWRRLINDDSGALAVFGRVGERAGREARKGLARGASEGGDNWLSGVFGKIAGAGLPLALQGVMYGIGARAAAVIGGGLLSQLSTVTTGVVGWASSIVGQVGQAVAGVGTVVAGTVGTAFAGLGATAYSSAAAILPAVLGLKAAFSGMEKEEKKAFDERLKNATENLQGFGKAVRAELVEPMFDAIKQFDAIVPTLNAFGTTLGKTAAGLIGQFADVFTSGPMIKELNTFLQASAGYLGQLGEAGIGLAAKILPAFNAIAPVTKKFFDDISGGMDSFADKIAKVSLGGKDSILTTTLDAWYERGKRLFGVFGTLAGTVFKVLNIGAEARGDTFLTSLEKTADKFKFFIDTIAANDVLSTKLGTWYDRGADLVGAFGNLSKIVLLFFDSAGDAAGNAFGSFRDVTEEWLDAFKEFRASGDLGDILKKWYGQGQTLLRILGNVGGSLVNIFKAASGTAGDFLGQFETVTQKWEDWTESVKGQRTLTDYFEGSADVLKEVWGLLGDISGIFGETFTGDTSGIVDFVKMLREDVVPTIKDFADTMRESGIQDSLFNLADSLGNLFDSTGGTMVATFFDTLSLIVDVIAELLDVLKPVLVPLATFLGYYKGLMVAKSVFSGLAALPAMLLNLVKPATDATEALGDLGDVDPSGRGRESTGRLGRAVAGLARGANIAALGYAGLATAISVSVPKFDDSTKHMNDLVENAKKGTLELDRTGKGIGKNWWEKYFFGEEGGAGILSVFGGDDVGARDFGEEIMSDIGSGADAGMKGWMAKIGLDWGGVKQTTEEVVAQFEAIGVAAEQTGDVETAMGNLAEFKKLLEDSGVSADLYADALFGAQQAINDTATENAKALDVGVKWEDAAKTAGQALAELAGQGIDTSTLAEIRDIYIDIVTAGAEASLIETTGILDPKIVNEQIEELKGIKGNWENGEWTKAGQRAYNALVSGFTQINAGSEVQEELDGITKTLATFDPSKGTGGQWTKEGLRLRAKIYAEADWTSINGVKNALPKDGEEYKQIIDIVKDPKQWDAATGELKLGAKTKIIELQLKGLEKAKADLAAFTGTRKKEKKEEIAGIKSNLIPGSVDYENDIKSARRRSKEDIDKFAIGLTVESTVTTAVERAEYDAFKKEAKETKIPIPFNADTSKLGPGTVQPIVTSKYKNNPVTVPLKWGPLPPLPKPPTTSTPSGYPARPGNPNLQMITPPSMISPGGPTTMGFGDSFTPFASSRAGGATGPGVVGSPNRWDDDDPKVKNVTINNYYPEPERASDTVAMSMRLARYGG